MNDYFERRLELTDAMDPRFFVCQAGLWAVRVAVAAGGGGAEIILARGNLERVWLAPLGCGRVLLAMWRRPLDDFEAEASLASGDRPGAWCACRTWAPGDEDDLLDPCRCLEETPAELLE